MKVQINADDMKATRYVTMSKLYELFKTNYYKNLSIKSLVNGRFSYLPIKTVVDKGVKECMKITLSDAVLVCTPDHLILTTSGWKQACELEPDDVVFTNGELVCKNCGSTQDICKNKTGKFYSYCRKCMYKLRNGTKFKDTDIIREINSERLCCVKRKRY